jgi:fatty-acyl-CoA synthase
MTASLWAIGTSGVGTIVHSRRANGHIPEASRGQNPEMTTTMNELTQLRSRTIWRTVLTVAEQFPDRDALVAANDAGKLQSLTYRELVARVRDLSAGFADIGMRRGDRVALWMTNTLEWVVSSFAVMRLGASLMPINTFLKPPEVKYLLAQSGARHLVMLDSFRALRMPQMLAEICPEFASTTRPGSLFSPELPDLRNVVLFHRASGTNRGAFDLAALEALGATDQEARELADALESQAQPSDLGMIKYTSGSTGFPKGVMLEQGGIVANAILHSRRIGILDADIFFSMMPFFHGGGSIWGLMTMMVNGGTLVFTEAFNATLAAELIARKHATIMFGVLGEEVVRAAVEKRLEFPSLRIAHVPNEDARRIMPNVTFCIIPFGLTETYGPAAVTSPTDPPSKRLNACGRMLDGNECRVVDPATGSDVAPGVPGEAWVRGNVMRGYWNKPEETNRVLDQDGWFHSEDIISVDEHGYITYVGRLKLMLKVGGENVSVEEVENVVTSHEAVAECGAVGVPDPRKGEAVRAYVAVRPGRKLDASELHAWLKPRLAQFKMPREIIFMDQLPRLANGKLDRVSLSKHLKEEVA